MRLIMKIKIWRVRVVPFVLFIVYRGVPFDEIVCFLIPSESEIQRRHIRTNTLVIATAKTKHL